MLTSEEEQDKSKVEHFFEILNKQAPENPPDNIAPATEDLDIDNGTDAPTKQEIIIIEAIKALKNNKTPRQDTLQPDLLKINPDLAADILLPLFESIWEQEQLPHDWTCGIKIPKKGKLCDCNVQLERDYTAVGAKQGVL